MIAVANKVDDPKLEEELQADFYSLGFEHLLATHPSVFAIGQGLWSPWYVGNSMTDLDKKFGKHRISPDGRLLAARAGGGFVVDAVCPLVTKVHHEVKVRAGKGYQIVYVGHEGHEEAVGTMAVAPDAIHRVESTEEVDALPHFDQPVALLDYIQLLERALGKIAKLEMKPMQPGDVKATYADTQALKAAGLPCDIVSVGSPAIARP